MTFIGALILGLLASAHCAAMCSGIQYALHSKSAIRNQSEHLRHTVCLNLGRITCYIAVGTLISFTSTSLLNLAGIQPTIYVLRLAVAIVLILIGVQMITQQTLSTPLLNKLGDSIWHLAKPFHKANEHNRYGYSFLNGMIWGLIPCGLLYSVWLSAVFSGTPIQGGLIMAGFGLGTLPSMLLSGSVWMHLKQFLNQKLTRVSGGLFYCFGGVLVLASPMIVNTQFTRYYPGLLIDTFFCIT